MGKTLTKGRRSIIGQVYLITACTKHREPLFIQFTLARIVVACMKKSQQRGKIQFLSWVIMPDHVHFLMSLEGDSSLSEVIGYIKGTTSHQICKRLNRKGGIWQAGFHDHAIRKEENIIEAARYIVANPLRAGIVKSLKQYPHWDSIYL
ncbi:transposase [Aliiglaciecola sp. 3_MG-2023]|uniref:REP-associated tyrosine transposase n=1 Tax=Aliiglaciecola sp. 3_MG-2023 TaxID=3062644 RepID=UPI0026E26B85|nr:transposase [Aliiglaciecola sp. 3_MG-2023]MDO6693217.1 transposase [Aliiglaciecola sp. 3_MG-2023]